MWKKYLIWFWRKRAKKTYLAFYSEWDSMDCGFNLAENMNPRLRLLRNQFNSAMKRLRELDPKGTKDLPSKIL